MIDNSSLVTVIIIFLDEEKFIGEAIESVLAQTYEHWELLLVDDGSRDNSTQIAQHYAAIHPDRISYLEHDGHINRGMSASRNLGIHHSRGDYIAFLDADDVWLPEKLEQQVAIIVSDSEIGMVYGLDMYWYSWTGKPEDRERNFLPLLGVEPNSLIRPPKLLPLFLLGKAAIPCPTNILVRWRVIERINGFEKSFRGLYEDQVFIAKVCLDTSVHVADKYWDLYRQHTHSSVLVGQKTGKEYFSRQNYLNWLSRYLIEREIHDGDVWYALNKARWLSQHPLWIPYTDSSHRILRWVKKWLLRLEEKIMPIKIDQWLWTRE